MGYGKAPTKDDIYILLADSVDIAREVRENMIAAILSEEITSDQLNEIKKQLEEMSTNLKIYASMEACLGLDRVCVTDSEVNTIIEAIDGTKRNVDFAECYLDYCDDTNRDLTLTCNFFCRHVLTSMTILKAEYGDIGEYAVYPCREDYGDNQMLDIGHLCVEIAESIAFNDGSRKILKRLLDNYEGGGISDDALGILIDNHRAVRNRIGILVDISKSSDSVCSNIAMTSNLIKIVNYARLLASLLGIYAYNDDDCGTIKLLGVHYEVVEVMHALLMDTRDGLGCGDCIYYGGDY